MGEEATPSSSSTDWKAEGNVEFRKKNYLKAAALYTKGIKADPTNAVLYSNRSACLLKLLKIQKAVADADECIRLMPDWEKGYFRKGSILEEIKDYAGALVAFKKAADLNPQNKEVTDKVKILSKLTRKYANASKQQGALNGHEVHGNGSATSDDGSRLLNGNSTGNAKATTVAGTGTAVQAYQKVKEHAAKGEAVELTEERVLSFAQALLRTVATETAVRTAPVIPSVHFLLGQRGESGADRYGEITIKEAFASPETLQQCVEFLRKYGEDTQAHAACLIVQKQDVSFPQVWKKKGFPKKLGNAIFVQLESTLIRRLWVIPESHKDTQKDTQKDAHKDTTKEVPTRDVIELSMDYQLIQPVLR